MSPLFDKDESNEVSQANGLKTRTLSKKAHRTTREVADAADFFEYVRWRIFGDDGDGERDDDDVESLDESLLAIEYIMSDDKDDDDGDGVLRKPDGLNGDLGVITVVFTALKVTFLSTFSITLMFLNIF